MDRLQACRTAALLFLLVMMFVGMPGPGRCAEGGTGWRTEFNDVCGKTMDAESMTTPELTALLGRCEKLRPQIEQLEESERKVMRRRLAMCCDLYKFMVETRTTPTR
jgi:hypothetical protein